MTELHYTTTALEFMIGGKVKAGKSLSDQDHKEWLWDVAGTHFRHKRGIAVLDSMEKSLGPLS